MKLRKRNIIKKIKNAITNNKLPKIPRMSIEKRKNKKRESRHLLSRANPRREALLKMLKDKFNL